MIRSTTRSDQKPGRNERFSASGSYSVSTQVRKSRPLGLALPAVEREERVEDSGLGEAEMAVAGRELAHGLRHRQALVQDEVERRREPGAVRARFAMHHRRVFDAVEEGLGRQDGLPRGRLPRAQDELHQRQALALAGLALEGPGAVLAPAPEGDHGPDPLAFEPGQLVRRRLGRAPELALRRSGGGSGRRGGTRRDPPAACSPRPWPARPGRRSGARSARSAPCAGRSGSRTRGSG